MNSNCTSPALVSRTKDGAVQMLPVCDLIPAPLNKLENLTSWQFELDGVLLVTALQVHTDSLSPDNSLLDSVDVYKIQNQLLTSSLLCPNNLDSFFFSRRYASSSAYCCTAASFICAALCCCVVSQQLQCCLHVVILN